MCLASVIRQVRQVTHGRHANDPAETGKKKAERDSPASPARLGRVQVRSGAACMARKAGPIAQIGQAAATGRVWHRTRWSTGTPRSAEPATGARPRRPAPGRFARASSRTSPARAARRSSPRTTAMSGSSDTRSSASGPEKLQWPTSCCTSAGPSGGPIRKIPSSQRTGRLVSPGWGGGSRLENAKAAAAGMRTKSPAASSMGALPPTSRQALPDSIRQIEHLAHIVASHPERVRRRERFSKRAPWVAKSDITSESGSGISYSR